MDSARWMNRVVWSRRRMAKPRHEPPPGGDLEQALFDLGRRLDLPTGENVLPAVRGRLSAAPPRPSLFERLFPPGPRRQLALGALALVLVVSVTLAVSPSTRETVADRLGLPGVSISTGETPATIPATTDLAIGEPTTLDAAESGAGFALAGPPESTLGAPDAVYRLVAPGGAQISYMYAPNNDLPEIGASGIGALISQFAGKTNASFIEKQLSPGTTIEIVTVNGQRGFWITGAPHVFYYEDPSGAIQEETVRLAGNVLLWERDGVTLRIESALAKEDAIRVAESMPAPES
jgi:hypothetical protein